MKRFGSSITYKLVDLKDFGKKYLDNFSNKKNKATIDNFKKY